MTGKRRLALLVAGCGLIFAFLTATTPLLAANKEKVLYSFCTAGCKDGDTSIANLIFDAAGRNLYGTTSKGGAYGCGTVFELARDRNETWSETVLYSFACRGDGDYPQGWLVFDSAGKLYGTTLAGGSLNAPICYAFFPKDGCGTVFQLTRRNGNWTKKTLHTFCPTDDNCEDGTNPYDSLILDKTGTLYGTTSFGGAYGNGTVFRLAPKNGMWKEKILHSFNLNHGDGSWPTDPLIFDAAGNLYGTNSGNVFQLTPNKNGRWQETVLHNFGTNGDGRNPYAGLIFDAAGSLYGTTPYGGGGFDCPGDFGCGTVFKLVRSVSGWAEEVLHRFPDNSHVRNTDGRSPWGGLIFDAAGNLYGTTSQGGILNAGTVFEITP